MRDRSEKCMHVRSLKINKKTIVLFTQQYDSDWKYCSDGRYVYAVLSTNIAYILRITVFKEVSTIRAAEEYC